MYVCDGFRQLSGAELASTNQRSENILRDLEDSKWQSQSQVRKLLFQKILMMVLHEEDDCSQLFFYDGGLVSVFTNFINKVISRQSNSESSLGTRSWQNGTDVCGNFYIPTNYWHQNIGSFLQKQIGSCVAVLTIT